MKKAYLSKYKLPKLAEGGGLAFQNNSAMLRGSYKPKGNMSLTSSLGYTGLSDTAEAISGYGGSGAGAISGAIASSNPNVVQKSSLGQTAEGLMSSSIPFYSIGAAVGDVAATDYAALDEYGRLKDPDKFKTADNLSRAIDAGGYFWDALGSGDWTTKQKMETIEKQGAKNFGTAFEQKAARQQKIQNPGNYFNIDTQAPMYAAYGGSLPTKERPLASARQNETYLPLDYNRPSYIDDKGNRRSEYKITIEQDGQHYVIPTVVNGKQLSKTDSYKQFDETGEHMGKFQTAEEAERASKLRTFIYNNVPQRAYGGPLEPLPTQQPTVADSMALYNITNDLRSTANKMNYDPTYRQMDNPKIPQAFYRDEMNYASQQAQQINPNIKPVGTVPVNIYGKSYSIPSYKKPVGAPEIAQQFAMGGDLPVVTQYDTGGTHEQNPNGGVAVDSQGNKVIMSKTSPVAMTEEGEVSWKNPTTGQVYVFSNRLTD
jgi:hypothetical protein